MKQTKRSYEMKSRWKNAKIFFLWIRCTSTLESNEKSNFTCEQYQRDL
jgi:hypothetical protein